MKILVLLIVVSLVVALLFLWLFVWSVKSGQYEDTDSPAVRMLLDDSKKPNKTTNDEDHNLT